jgi:hypothetical protein
MRVESSEVRWNIAVAGCMLAFLVSFILLMGVVGPQMTGYETVSAYNCTNEADHQKGPCIGGVYVVVVLN